MFKLNATFSEGETLQGLMFLICTNLKHFYTNLQCLLTKYLNYKHHQIAKSVDVGCFSFKELEMI